jgi:DNA-binding response OmpR family regulator
MKTLGGGPGVPRAWRGGAAILVVEGERATPSAAAALAAAGYRVRRAGSAAEAEALLDDGQPDLVVLDLLLPDADGLELCLDLKQEVEAPIVVCSATRRRRDPVLALRLGAEDFIARPFAAADLVARVAAVLRRAAHLRAAELAAAPRTRLGDLVIDHAHRHVTVAGLPLELTPTEYRLLVALARRPAVALSREELAEAVWGDTVASTGRSIDTHLCRLRGELAAAAADGWAIVAVRGFGYKLVAGAVAGRGAAATRWPGGAVRVRARLPAGPAVQAHLSGEQPQTSGPLARTGAVRRALAAASD